ncbi:fructokinase [Photorhabdus temperata]|nr:fructokinase [Photorhabdus temperata]
MRIGVDLGGTKIEVIALGEQGKELFRKRVDTPRDNYQKTLQAIAGLVTDTEQATGQKGSVGIGIPGVISPFNQKVKNANSVWLNGQVLDKDISALLGREVRVANDANCLAISEATDGAGAGMPLVFAVIIGTGCGAGISVNGQVHSGGNGLAGEWGHNPLPWPDADELLFQQEVACYCGKPGCTEIFVSGTGLMTDYFRLSGQHKKGHEIIEAIALGDQMAELAMHHYELRLAKVLGQVINLLDPDVIVLGGGMSNVDRLYQTLPDLLKKWVFGGECATPIRKAVHGDSSGVRGAAWLWPQK